MSADLLREAAALVRARAEAATPGPWSARTTGVRGGDHWYICDEGKAIAHISANDGVNEAERQPDAEHIASWHPAVALAVAKAMDDVAQAWEISDGWVMDLDDDPIRFEDTVDGGWLNVARAYLGRDS